jgi:Cys-rich protein (TIGR01571 family)
MLCGLPPSPQVAAGQVIKRLQLTLTIEPADTVVASTFAFQVTYYITIIMWVLRLCFLVLDFPQNIIVVHRVLMWMFSLFTTAIVLRLRWIVREKYQIPGHCFADFCCTFWCRCCVIGQMLRHTTDYDVYPGRVCSSNGLSPQVNPMVV